MPASSRRQCHHCGTPFTPRQEGERFCCAGCEAVSEMIDAQGLGHFYDLRKGISKPARQLEPQDFSWLQTLATQAEADARASGDDHARLALPLTGIHCMGCRWLISELFAQQEGHESCELDAEGRHIRFGWKLPQADAQAGFNPVAFADALLTFGYALENPALPRTAAASAAADVNTRKRLLPRLLLCGVFTLNAVIFSLPVRLGANAQDFPLLRLFGMLVLLCATLSTALAASYFWQKPRFRPAKDAAAHPQPATLPLRRGVSLLLLALWLLTLSGGSLGLPSFFAADAAAGISFATLLAAFALGRAGKA